MQLTIVKDGHVRDGATLDDLAGTQRPFWVDVQAPTAEEMHEIAKFFGLHRMTAADCLNRLVPVKWELFREYLYVVTHGLNFNEGSDLLETLNLSVVLFEDCCVTVHAESMRSVAGLLSDLRAGKPRLAGEKTDEILYTLLATTSSLYGTLVEEVEDVVEEIDDAVLDGRDLSNMLERIGESRRHLAVLRRRLSPMRESLQQLSMRDNPFIHQDSRVYVRDVLDDVIRNLEKSEVVRDMLTNAQSNYLAQLANQTNEVMKTLSIVATIMMPLSLLTGLFGMNVRVPGQGVENLVWFGCLVLFMIVVAVGLLMVFRKRGWI